MYQIVVHFNNGEKIGLNQDEDPERLKSFVSTLFMNELLISSEFGIYAPITSVAYVSVDRIYFEAKF